VGEGAERREGMELRLLHEIEIHASSHLVEYLNMSAKGKHSSPFLSGLGSGHAGLGNFVRTWASEIFSNFLRIGIRHLT